MGSVLFTDRVKALGLPLDQCIVIGSGVMDALGIRKSADIDLVVSNELFAELKTQGWRVEVKHNEEVLLKDDVEAWLSWGISGDMLTFEGLLLQSIVIDGVQFCTPVYLMKWKQHKARPKDIADVKLLEEYAQSHE